MSLIAEYKRSLKSIEVEEILDLVIYRPVSFVMVKLIYNTNITPNQISIIAMIFGILAGIFFGLKENTFLILACISFFLCNTLDCVDGQLARLKRNGTRIGRIIDGFIDYISSIAVFVGIGIALSSLTGEYLYSWILTVAAGISKALQNMFFDNYRNLYLKYVYDKASDINDEIAEFTEEKKNLQKEKGKFIQKILVNSYLKYCKIQGNSTNHKELNIKPSEYKATNILLIRSWSWIGSTTHMTALIIFTLFMGIEGVKLYLITTIIFGNLLFLINFSIQKFINKKLSKL